MTSLSSSIRYGKAVYRVFAGVGDGPDANLLPDAVPVTGSGWLTPRVERIVDRGSSPAVTVLPRQIPVLLVDGQLTYRGDPWVWLLASEPGVWRWHAQFTYQIGGETVSDEFSFDLLPGDPEDPDYVGTDLSVSRVVTDPGTGLPTVVGPAGRSVVDVLLVDNGLLFVMSQGEDIALPIPAFADLAGAADAAARATEAANQATAAVATIGTAADDAAAAAITATGAATTATDTAATVATDAASAAWSAGQAAAAATAATTAATTATSASTAAADAAAEASTGATNATNAASRATNAVQAATTEATTATNAAATATTKAAEAATSAAEAAQSAADAADAVSSGMPSATTTIKGGIRLAGDLAGTSDAPTVPGLAAKAPLEHTHSVGAVTGLQAALDAKATEAYVDGKVAGLVDSAPETLDTLNELATALGNDPNFATTVATQIGGKADRVHGHEVAEVAGLSDALSGKAPLVHTHTLGQVSGLQGALDGKSDTGHAHQVSDVTGLSSTLAGKADLVAGRLLAGQIAAGGSDGQVLAKDGSGAVWVDPPEGGGGGVPSTPDGPLATASATYKAAATAARTRTGQLRVLTLGDSTCDGYIGGLPGGPTKWSDTWPNLLAAKLRTAWGLPAGGTGWLPLRHENAVAGDYSFPQSTSSDGYWSPVVGDTGIAGSQWMVPRSEGGRRVTVPLEPGLTSVDLLSTAWEGNHATGLYPQIGESVGFPHEGQYIEHSSVPTPGSSIGIESVGSGWQALGAVGYAGDETRGVVTYNWGVAGISAAEVANRIVLEAAQEALADIAPHVVLVCLGANDYNDRTVAQVRASFAAIHTALTTAAPGAQVVFVTRPLTGTKWAAYADGILAEAAARGAHGLDLRVGVPAGTPGVYVSDGVHLTLAGNIAYAEAVAEYMAVGSEGLTTSLITDMSVIGRQLARATTQAEARQIVGTQIYPVRMTQAQYNALPTPRDPNVLYLIKG